MTRKSMTVAVLAALALTVVAMAGGHILRSEAHFPAALALGPEGPPRTDGKGGDKGGDKELSGYRDPHARPHNIATRTVSSCWVRTRYGTVDICETDGRAD